MTDEKKTEDGYSVDKKAVAKAHGIKTGFIKFGENDPELLQAYEIAKLIKSGAINRVDLPMLVERGVSKKAVAFFFKNRPRLEAEVSPSVAGFNKFEFKRLSAMLEAMDPESDEYKTSKKMEQEAIDACVEYIKKIKPHTIISDEDAAAETARRKQLLDKYGPAVPIDEWVKNWMTPGHVAVNLKSRYDIYKETGKWPEEPVEPSGPSIPFEYLPRLGEAAKSMGLQEMAQTAFDFEQKRAKQCGGENNVSNALGKIVPDLFYRKGPVGSDNAIQLEFKKVRKFDKLPSIQQRRMHNLKQFDAACERFVNDIYNGDELKKLVYLKQLRQTLLKPKRTDLKSYRTNGATEAEVYFTYFTGLIDDKMKENFPPPKPQMEKIVEKKSWISKFFGGLRNILAKLFK
jgi:hypothetical protein